MKPRFGSKAHQAAMRRHNSYSATMRRVNRARNFPTNTCPASRHAVMIAEQIRNGYDFGSDCEEDREHTAASILSVVESLWKLRTRVAKGGQDGGTTTTRPDGASPRPPKLPFAPTFTLTHAQSTCSGDPVNITSRRVKRPLDATASDPSSRGSRV